MYVKYDCAPKCEWMLCHQHLRSQRALPFCSQRRCPNAMYKQPAAFSAKHFISLSLMFGRDMMIFCDDMR